MSKNSRPVSSSVNSPAKAPIGGGFKKVLYTLQTVQRIGLKDSAKALTAKNACKACGLGMGGQRGGMTNELDEFPSVCNKSVQAQSTDIQPPIPSEIFEHSLEELAELSGKEIEQLGRLGSPIYKAKGESRFKELSWSQALEQCVQGFSGIDPQRSFFYSSGRSSNEAGFVLQLFARLYGTNNVNNCSYYCHQATGVGLGTTIGTGTATIELADLHGCDLVFIIGANPASNHPRLIHKLKQCRERGGHVVVINPAKEPGLVRFAVPKSPASLIAGGTEIASAYLQPRIGKDIILLNGIAKAVIEAGACNDDFIAQHTLGFDEWLADIQQLSWQEIVDECGVTRDEIEQIGALYAKSSNAVFAWGMGVTHHIHGVENVEAIANLALMRGMVGKQCAGLLPLRGHSNVQGIGTIGVKPLLAQEVIEKIESMVGARLPQDKGLDTLACLQSAERGEIDAALMLGGNLLEATPDTAWAKRVFHAIPFKVFLTTTLNRGHVLAAGSGGDDEVLILPVLARDEEQQSTTQESMFNYVRLSDGGIDRISGARSEVEILVDLASELLDTSENGFDFSAFRKHESIRAAIAATVPGMQAIKDIGVAKQEFYVRQRIKHIPEFQTESGKAHFQVVSGPVSLPVSPGSASEYPFTLATVRSEGQFNSIVYEEQDSYRGTDSRWVVMVSPEDARRLSLSEGQAVTLQSAYGEMKGVRVHLFDLAEGGLLAYYPEANVLTGQNVDPRSRTPNFKSIAVSIVAE